MYETNVKRASLLSNSYKFYRYCEKKQPFSCLWFCSVPFKYEMLRSLLLLASSYQRFKMFCYNYLAKKLSLSSFEKFTCTHHGHACHGNLGGME